MVADKCYTNVLYYSVYSYHIVDFAAFRFMKKVQYTMILCLVSLLYLTQEWTFFEFC